MNNSKVLIDAIIFDFDGVLAESVNIKGDAFVELYRHESMEVQNKVLAYHNENGGVTRYDKIRYYEKTLCNRNVTESRIMEIAGNFSDIVEDLVIKSPWVEGSKDFLDRYYKIIPFYVASATPEDELKRIVKNRNMDHYFKGVYGAPKKKHEHITAIIDQYNYKKQRILMIGDAITDYNAAQKSGTKFIGRNLPNQASPFPAGIIVMNDLRDLEDLIKLK